jgi:hypothetical protein
MKVIRHDHEAASAPTVTLRAVEEKTYQALESALVVQHADAAIHAERQQVGDVAITVRPDAVEPPQASGWWVGRSRAAA